MMQTQSLEQTRIDRDNRQMNERLVKAMKGGRYPGPKEAAETMKQIDKIRTHQTKKRLKVTHLSPPPLTILSLHPAVA